MKKRLTHVNPFHFGTVTGALGLLWPLFSAGFFLVTLGIGMVTQDYHGLRLLGLDTIVLELLIPMTGFLYGVLGAVVYNLVAKWTGGVELTISDVAPQEPPPWPQALPKYPFAPR